MGKRKGKAMTIKPERARKNLINIVSNKHTTANRKTERQAASGVVSKADLRSSVNMGVGYPHYWACLPPLPPIR